MKSNYNCQQHCSFRHKVGQITYNFKNPPTKRKNKSLQRMEKTDKQEKRNADGDHWSKHTNTYIQAVLTPKLVDLKGNEGSNPEKSKFICGALHGSLSPSISLYLLFATHLQLSCGEQTHQLVWPTGNAINRLFSAVENIWKNILKNINMNYFFIILYFLMDDI